MFDVDLAFWSFQAPRVDAPAKGAHARRPQTDPSESSLSLLRLSRMATKAQRKNAYKQRRRAQVREDAEKRVERIASLAVIQWFVGWINYLMPTPVMTPRKRQQALKHICERQLSGRLSEWQKCGGYYVYQVFGLLHRNETNPLPITTSMVREEFVLLTHSTDNTNTDADTANTTKAGTVAEKTLRRIVITFTGSMYELIGPGTGPDGTAYSLLEDREDTWKSYQFTKGPPLRRAEALEYARRAARKSVCEYGAAHLALREYENFRADRAGNRAGI